MGEKENHNILISFILLKTSHYEENELFDRGRKEDKYQKE